MRDPFSFYGVRITETDAFPPVVAHGDCIGYVTLNAEIALLAREDSQFKALLNSPKVRVSVDGQWVLWGLRRKYRGVAFEKLSGSDLIFRLALHCAEQGERLALLGSSAENNAAAVARLRERHPGLQVEGLSPPHFTIEGLDDEQVSQPARAWIREVRPRHVVLGLGTPKEEYWLAHELDWLRGNGVAAVFCFGGAIDFASGTVPRAPVSWQRLGLEGVYRVLRQPRRLMRFLRVLRILPSLITGRY